MTHRISAPAPFTSYQKIVLSILALLQFVVLLDFMIISPIGYILIKDLSITTGQFGLLVSSYIFSAAASGLIFAGFIDRYDRKKALIFFFTGFIGGTLLCAFSGTYYTLLIARVISGIFGGVVVSLTMTIIADVFEPEKRGRAMSTVQMSFAGSQILGVPLGLLIANAMAWQYTFLLIVIISLLLLFFVLRKLKPLNEHLRNIVVKDPFLHLWHTLIDPLYRKGFSAVIVLGSSMMLQPFISIFLTSNLFVPNADLPLIFMVTGAAAFFVMPLVGKLSDRFGKFRVFLAGSFATILVVPVYTHLPVVPLWVILLMNVVMFAVIMGRMGPFQALNSMIPQPAARGAYMSVSSSLQQMAGGLGVLIAGSIVFQETPASPLENFDRLGFLVVGLTAVAVVLVHRVNKIVDQK